MQFIRQNINKSLRNGEIVATQTSSSYYKSGSSGGGGIMNGDYLPATSDENGVYIVPHYVTFQETTTSTDTEGNETEVIKNLLEITKDGIIVNGNIIASGEVSAYGSGSTSGGSNVDVDLSDYYTKDEVDDLIDNIDVSGIDLSDYSKTSHTHSNYALTSHTHSNYSLTSHTHPISAVTNLQTTLDGKVSNTAFTAHTASTTVHITSNDRNKWNSAYTHISDSVTHVTESDKTNWNNKLNKSIWDSVFEIDDSNNLRVKLNLIGEKDVSAYGSGETGNTSIDLENYYTKEEVDDLIDNIDTSSVDLSGYSKTSHTHSNYALTSHTHSGYALTSHTHPQYASSSHTHNYASTVKVGTTSYSVSANTISLPSYPTLSSLSGVSTSTFNTHSGNTTLHITTTERTNWNTAYNNSHTHSNKSVLDGITSTKVSNWDTVYSNWNKVFSFDSSGNLKVSVNVIGEGEISAYGSGTSSSSGAITIVDNLTSTLTDAALSANQGRILKNLIDNIDVDNIDLSGYSKTSHTHSNYSLTSHTHSGYASTSHTHTIANITNLQSTLDAKSGTGHTHSNYSPTSHTHSNYSLTSHTHSAYASSSHTHNYVSTVKVGTTSYSVSANTISLPSYPTLSSLGAASSSHTHSNYSLTSHTHSYLPLNNTAQVYVNSTQTGVVNFKSTSGSEVGVRMYLGDTNLGGLWGNANDGIYMYRNENGGDKLGIRGGAPYFYDASANSGTYYTLLHRGNLSTGAFGNNKLDTMVQYTIDTTALSTSNYYPIVFAASPKMLRVSMYSQTGSSSAAYNCNTLDFSFRGMGWSDVPQGLTVHHYNTYTETEKTIGCIGMGQEGGMKVVWVRGGLTYYIASNITPVLCSTNYTNGNEIFTVGTNQYGGTNTKVTVLWTPQSTSGRGTLYHSAGLALGGGFSLGGAATLKSSLAVTGTSTFTGAATFNGGLTSTTVTTRNVRLGDTFQATISSAGWYRFATSHSADNAGGTYIFFIKRNYYNSDNEAYIISCTVDDNKVHWCQLNGSANARLISQVRATWTNNSTMYFDFNYTGTVANTVTVNCVGNATCQVPTLTSSALSSTKVFTLTDGIKLGTTSAYPITVFRDNSTGGAYIQYGALNQLTKTWAAGSNASHQFSWYYKDTSAGTDVAKMWLTSDSKLNFAAGVGSRKLVINGDSAAFQFYSTTDTASWAMGNFFYNNSGSAIGQMGAYGAGGTLSYYYVGSAYNNANAIKFYNTGNMGSAYWTLNNTTTNPYLKLVHTYNSTTYTHYLQGYQGYLALGTTSTKSLKIDSNGNCVAAGEVTAHSDKRLKSNIKPLNVRGELNPVTYVKDGKESIGFIADEVKELYPELVHTDEGTEEKYLSLNYAQLTAVLYAEIKDLKERIKKLENK